jgi:hypothetical protein
MLDLYPKYIVTHAIPIVTCLMGFPLCAFENNQFRSVVKGHPPKARYRC